MDLPEFKELMNGYYRELNVFEFELLYIYSDLRGYAAQLSKDIDRNSLFRAVITPLIEKGITVLTPTFTYTTSGEFEVTRTMTRLGALNKWFLSQKGVRRSEHPLFSDAAIGPRSNLVERVGKSAFGSQSVFDRLKGTGCGFLHLGHDLSKHGNTVIHHVEQMCGVTYRIHKAFNTRVYKNDKFIGTDYTAFLRRRDVATHDFITTFEDATQEMRKHRLLRERGDPTTQRYVALYGFDESISLFSRSIYRDPSFFIGKQFIQY